MVSELLWILFPSSLVCFFSFVHGLYDDEVMDCVRDCSLEGGIVRGVVDSLKVDRDNETSVSWKGNLQI